MLFKPSFSLLTGLSFSSILSFSTSPLFNHCNAPSAPPLNCLISSPSFPISWKDSGSADILIPNSHIALFNPSNTTLNFAIPASSVELLSSTKWEQSRGWNQWVWVPVLVAVALSALVRGTDCATRKEQSSMTPFRRAAAAAVLALAIVAVSWSVSGGRTGASSVTCPSISSPSPFNELHVPSIKGSDGDAEEMPTALSSNLIRDKWEDICCSPLHVVEGTGGGTGRGMSLPMMSVWYDHEELGGSWNDRSQVRPLHGSERRTDLRRMEATWVSLFSMSHKANLSLSVPMANSFSSRLTVIRCF